LPKRVKLPHRDFVLLDLDFLEKMSAHVLDIGLCDGRRQNLRLALTRARNRAGALRGPPRWLWIMPYRRI